VSVSTLAISKAGRHAQVAGEELRDPGRCPNDAQGPVRDRRPGRRDRRPLQVRAGLALVDRDGPAGRKRLVPDPPSRLLDVRRGARCHGRRADARHRSGHGVRHPAGPRQVGRRRRALGHDRVGRQRTRPRRCPPGGRRTIPLDGPLHRHRRLDGPAPGGWRRPLARSARGPQRAPPRAAERPSRTRGEDDRRRAPRDLRQPDRSVRAIGLEIRAGLHTGEIELVGDDVRGIAVHAAARILALAGPGEVLVSSTTGALIEGSGIELEDAGAHELKGLPGLRQVFRLVVPPTP
jgi:hypothetical protein